MYFVPLCFVVLSNLAVCFSDNYGSNVQPAYGAATNGSPSGSPCRQPTGQYPDPSNCGSYYDCWKGDWTHMHCDKGLHFDQNKKYCGIPSQVSCTGSTGPTGSAPSVPNYANVPSAGVPPGSSYNGPSQPSYTTTTTTAYPSYTTPYPTTPVVVPGYGAVAYPQNPSQPGIAIGGGNYPANNYGTTASPPVYSSTYTVGTTNGYHDLTFAPYNTFQPYSPIPTLFPWYTGLYNNDASTTYPGGVTTGSYGNPSYTTQASTYPANYGTSSPSHGNGYSTESKGYLKAVVVKRSATNELVETDFICPVDRGLFPHANDCTSFWNCGDGLAYLQACPKSLLFDPEYQQCEWFRFSTCVDGKIVQHGRRHPTSTHVVPATFPSTQETVTPSSDSQPRDHRPQFQHRPRRPHVHGRQGKNKFNCPARTGFYADPNNCGSFYQCVAKVAYHFYCPGRLHYNPNNNVCDWPEQVGCAETKAATATPIPTEVTTTITVNNDTTTAQTTTSSSPNATDTVTNATSSGDAITTTEPTKIPTDNSTDVNTITTEAPVAQTDQSVTTLIVAVTTEANATEMPNSTESQSTTTSQSPESSTPSVLTVVPVLTSTNDTTEVTATTPAITTVTTLETETNVTIWTEAVTAVTSLPTQTSAGTVSPVSFTSESITTVPESTTLPPTETPQETTTVIFSSTPSEETTFSTAAIVEISDSSTSTVIPTEETTNATSPTVTVNNTETTTVTSTTTSSVPTVTVLIVVPVDAVTTAASVTESTVTNATLKVANETFPTAATTAAFDVTKQSTSAPGNSSAVPEVSPSGSPAAVDFTTSSPDLTTIVEGSGDEETVISKREAVVSVPKYRIIDQFE